MHRSKRNKCKAGIAIVGMLLLLALMVWVPVPAVGAYEGTSGLAGLITVTVQATPTEDATVAALNKEKLVQEVQQLKNQNRPDLSGWLQPNASIFISTLVVVIGGLFGFWQWRVGRRDAQNKELKDRQDERDKRAEERLKGHFERLSSIVAGLGNENSVARTGAAVLLRIFLDQGYEQFYKQAFDLVVANLRPPILYAEHPRTSNLPEDPNTALPLTPFRQALIIVFQESFPVAREELKEREGKRFNSRSLDATGINLDKAFLWAVDLGEIWMPWASMRETNFSQVKLQGAKLWWADLTNANLWGADLEEADLGGADLGDADLTIANLTGAKLWAKLKGAKLLGAKLTNAKLCRGKYVDVADLSGADLSGADLSGADLRYTKLNKARLCLAMLTQSGPQTQGPQVETIESEAEFSKAKLQGTTFIQANLRGPDLSEADPREATFLRAILHEAKLQGADLSGAKFFGADLTGANIEDSLSLKDTDLRGVKGLDEKKLKACKAKGAIIGEDTTTSPPQSAVSPSPPSQSNDVQAPPTPDTGGSGAASSESDSQL